MSKGNIITKPKLIVDEARCRQNIAHMAAKAKAHKLKLRPHFKTHQSHQIGEWCKEAGITAITVSSIGMAQYFVEAGWQEITIAFPLNVLRLHEIDELAEKATINVLVDNEVAVEALTSKIKNQTNCYIEIDSGDNRSGIPAKEKAMITALAEKIHSSEKLRLLGCYTHAGHTYDARGINDIRRIATEAMSNFREVRSYFPDEQLEFCWGDTPSCSVMDTFEEIDAISCGNFVFYDLIQTYIGSCSIDDVAVAMYCPVVAKKEAALELCVHGGAIHFSKDHIVDEERKIYGVAVDIDTWQPIEGSYVRALSQEHGMIKVDPEFFKKTVVGDTIAIIPVHSCLTAQAMGRYFTKKRKNIAHYAQKNRD